MKLKDIINEELNKFIEGVGDKYAERKWGIPDEQNAYKSQTDPAVQSPDMGKLAGYTTSDNYDNNDKIESSTNEPIYLNPKSLNKFDKGVRAVSDASGNLYVAQHDGEFLHGGFAQTLGINSFDVYDIVKYITWHRVKNTNKFGLATSSAEYLNQINAYKDVKTLNKFKENLDNAKRINPQFEFIPETFYFINEDIVEGVGDKYAERKWGIPDETSNNTYRPKDEINGELAGEVFDENGKLISNIYRNPRSLKNFDKNCRAVSDYQGNLYVGQLDGDYWHNAIATAVQYGGKFQLSYAYDNSRNLTWHRVETTEDFGLSISSYKYTKMPENQEDVKERIGRVESKNPSFEFIPKYWEYLTRGQIDNDETADELSMMETIVNEEIQALEGVGDKYAERKWGIPDETRSNVVAGQGVNGNPNLGELVGIVYNPYNGQAITNVYLNPRSLSEFDKDVRAVSDRSGNLFVAQFDGNYNHEAIGNAVMDYGKHRLKYVYDNDNNLTWHRIHSTNEFGFSITSIDAGNKNYYSVENQEERKKILEAKNPQFTFTFKYWEYIIDGDPYDGYELDNNYGREDDVNYDDVDNMKYSS